MLRRPLRRDPSRRAECRRSRAWGLLSGGLLLAVWAVGASAQPAGRAGEAPAWAAAAARPNTQSDSTRSDNAPATDSELRVEGVGGAGVAAPPGSVVTAVFRVTNAGDRPLAVAAALDVAPGWESVLPLRPFEVAGGGSDLRLVSVRVPADAAPGAYRVHYRVSEPGAAGASGGGALTVTVPAVYGIALETEDAPTLATAGTPYGIRLLAVNTGNTPATVSLDASSNLGAPLALDSAVVRLRPGELRRVTLTASPARALAARVRHVVRVRASVEGGPEAALATVTDLVPPVGVATTSSSSLDAEVALRAVQANGEAGGQIDAAGALPLLGGTLDGAVTLAGRERASVYGDRSRYSLRYVAEGLAVTAGDHVFALSPLTETGRFGFGVGAEATAGALSGGAFYHRPRYGITGDAFGGAFAGVRVAPRAELRANVLHQGGARRGDAVTLQGTVGSGGASALDVECGLGTSTEPAGGTARACSSRLTVDTPGLSVHASAVGADPGFPGRSRDTRAVSGSAVARPWQGVRLEGTLQDSRWGSTLGDFSTQTYRVGVGLVSGAQTRPAQAGVYLAGRRYQTGPDRSLDRREEGVEAVLSYTLGRFGLRASAETGYVAQDARGAAGVFQRGQARGQLALGAGSVYLGVERRTGRTLDLAGGGWRADVGGTLGTGRTQLSVTTTASLDARSALALGRQHVFAQARFAHTLPSGQRVELDGRRFAAFGGTASQTSEVRISYVVPLRVAVARHTGGTVRGRVFDAETGAGIAEVAVTLAGRSALTDLDGAFVLPRPAEGTGYLRIDRVGAGIDRVPLREMPIPIEGGTGPLPDLEIPLLRGARLSGALRVMESQDPAASGGVPRAVLEIEGGGRRLRTVAGRDGRFVFDGVPPGDWTLRVLHAELPRHHVVEHDAYAVALAPGEHGRIEIGVRPRARAIRLVETGTVVRVSAEGGASPDRPRSSHVPRDG